MQSQRLVITLLALAAVAAAPAVLAQHGRGRGGGGILPPLPVGRADNPPAARVEQRAGMNERSRTQIGGNQERLGGFRDERELNAAQHASQNLNIPFDQLKHQMTEGNGKSLGQAIHTLRPDMDKKAVKENVKMAERAAANESRPRVQVSSGLSSRVSTLLPSGMSMEQASAGFRNTGQFVAALHVARNLNIPFRDLRARMIAGGESLGEAIHSLRPAMSSGDVEASVRVANEAARQDVRAEESAEGGFSKR